ncbi:MAG: 6-phospho-beta-glucosidase [Deltaproteobacteria bacterium]|nr:6-phospho-beta-glucosidase [Deltaproteobacteria bacterium]
MKIGIIGGGSTYTPEVIEGFIIKAGDLGLTEVVLMDIDGERLRVVGDFAKRMVKHAGNPFKLTTTAARVEAIDGADFVLTQFRVGGQAARHEDIMLGLRHGLIGQETTGIGGMAKALRTIPVILDICADVEKRAPNAWVINFTNPSGLITEAILNHTGVSRCIGLCNVPIDMKMMIAKHLGVDDADVQMDSVGLNHLGWVRRVIVKGEDITARLLDFLAGEEGPKNIPDIQYNPELIRALGQVPLYYCRYFYNTPSVLAELKAKKKSRAQEVMDIEKALLAQYQDPNLATKPKELEQRGGAYYSKIAVEIVEAIAGDTGAEHTVNTRNEGAVPDLPASNVVEIPCRIGRDGVTPVPTEPLEPSIRALIQAVKAYEELTVEAALKKSRAAAFRALITNPLGPKSERASDVLDDLLKTNNLSYS